MSVCVIKLLLFCMLQLFILILMVIDLALVFLILPVDDAAADFSVGFIEVLSLCEKYVNLKYYNEILKLQRVFEEKV